jgi:hypothetical protein
VLEDSDPARQLAYRLASGLFNQPRLLRAIAALARRDPLRAASLRLVATATGVREVLSHEASFTHGHYPSVLVGGPFLIGMPSGQAHRESRQCLMHLLPSPAELARETQTALAALLQNLTGPERAGRAFDLVEDVLAPLVWRALHRAFNAGHEAPPLTREWLLAARWLGAQLMIGSVAPMAVTQRAQRSAAVLERAFMAAPARAAGSGAQRSVRLHSGWQSGTASVEQQRRDAVGLLWVGHPSTVQAGALMLLELLARPALFLRLSRETADVDWQAPWPDWLRERLLDHVLELLRFRPPFPLLARQVPRPAAFLPDAACAMPAELESPGSVLAMLIGALFDPKAQQEDPRAYLPGRHFHHPEDRFLIFGAGDRHCIAREHVLEILVTALGGYLALHGRRGRLHRRWSDRLVWDGPVIARMPVRLREG